MKPTRWARSHDCGDDPRHHLAAWDRAGFARLLWAEFTKFRTVRARVVALCAAAIVLVLLSFVSAFASRAPVPAPPTGPDGEAVSDTYMFVHRTLAGDGALTARVAALSGAHTPLSPTSGSAFGTSSKGQPGSRLEPGLAPWAKAGIILEPDTNQGTAYAAVMVTGSHGVQMQYDYTHDSPGIAGPAGPSSPRWLRLTRAGDVITGYASTDGSHWTQIGTARLARLPRTVQIGLFVTSPVYFPAGADVGTPSVATARFDHISAQGDLPRRSWTPDTIAGFYPTVPSASTWQQPSAGAFTISGSGDIAPLVGDILSPQWAGASIVNGTIVALLIVIVLATLFATSEYRRGLIRTTFAASPRRGRVLAAKAVVAGSLAFAAGAIATAIAEVITRHVLAANGSYLFPQSGPDLARVIIGTGLLLGLAAVLAVALGTMLRRSAPAVAAGIVLLVLPGIFGTVSGRWNWPMRLTPTAAFAIQATLPRSNLVTSAYTPPNGYFPISPWAGLAVLAAYTAVALGAAEWLLRRRDA
jgi:ABC-type transport system involved in multi-copper enzyme maturation permease subunit